MIQILSHLKKIYQYAYNRTGRNRSLLDQA